MRKHADSDNEISDEALLSGIAVRDDQAVLIFVRRYQVACLDWPWLSLVTPFGRRRDTRAFIRIFATHQCLTRVGFSDLLDHSYHPNLASIQCGCADLFPRHRRIGVMNLNEQRS